MTLSKRNEMGHYKFDGGTVFRKAGTGVYWDMDHRCNHDTGRKAEYLLYTNDEGFAMEGNSLKVFATPELAVQGV